MTSFDRFNRTVTDRYSTFKNRLDAAIAAFSGDDKDRIKLCAEKASRVEKAGNDLLDILSEIDRPKWLKPITEASKNFAANPNRVQAKSYLEDVVRRYHQVGPINVVDSSGVYDFDSLYERLRSEGQLPSLFDKMMEAVSNMLEHGELESVTVIKALQRLLDALKANREGSYLAMSNTIDFAVFIRNFCGEFLKRIPGVKEYAVAMEKTVKAAEAERAKLDSDLQRESLALIVDAVEIAKLKQLPSREPLVLFAVADADVADAETVKRLENKSTGDE